MKKISTLIFSALLIANCIGAAYAGNSDKGAAAGKNELRNIEAAEFIDAPLFSSLFLGSNHFGFFSESFVGSVSATPAPWNGSVQFEGAESVLPLEHLFKMPGMRPTPLFITESITKGSSSVPEASTMLLLGLALVGLAGYGGRKKFKH